MSVHLPNEAFEDFATLVKRAPAADPRRVARAASTLVEGAMRIRRGGDGLYAAVDKPSTKQAEAIGAWLRSMEKDIIGGEEFHRQGELREALTAAAEEVGHAALATPAATRLRDALYTDAISVFGAGGGSGSNAQVLPWALAAGLGGILVGVLFARKKRSRR